MKSVFQFKQTTNPTDVVAEKAATDKNENFTTHNNNNHHHLNTLSELPFFLTHTINSTFKRRFSENFYKTYDIHKRPRLVKKCGELNIHMENVPKHKRRLLSDFFNTVLDVKWRWHVAIFLLTFLISWFVFATIWYMIAFIHGDLAQRGNDTHTPCVTGVHDFTSALLYSVETQHTIGYGLRHITEECSFAIIFLMLQSCFGIFVQGLVAGVVFAKISRPSKRKRTIIFSHNAVVSERDGKLCFMFKLANIRISQLSDAKIKIIMIKSRRTDEGEFIPFQSYDMKVGHNWSGNDSVFFPWPKTVEHVIDEESPLYEICKQAKCYRNKPTCHKSNSDGFDELSDSTINSTDNKECDLLLPNKYEKNSDYEIVVILEGNIETTGASCHIRTSYLPQEILFGYRFVPVYPKFTDFEYLFDYSKFDQVEIFQYDLLDLNVAINNPHLNLVYDARAENKNFNLTCQNTLQKEEKSKNKPPTMPLASIFENLAVANLDNNDKSRGTYDKKVSKSELEQLTETQLKKNDTEETKHGRFTVCAVDKKNTSIRKDEKKEAKETIKQIDQDQSTNLVSMSINERMFGSLKNNIEKKVSNHLSKQTVILQMHKRHQLHHRTNSLPDSHSDMIVNNCNNDDEGYLTSNKNNSKVDLND